MTVCYFLRGLGPHYNGLSPLSVTHKMQLDDDMFFRRMEKHTYLSSSICLSPFLRLLTNVLLFRPFFFYWTRDCPQPALDPLAKKKINRSSFFLFFFRFPFLVWFATQAIRVKDFISRLWRPMTNLPKKIASPFSLASSYLYIAVGCVCTHTPCFLVERPRRGNI